MGSRRLGLLHKVETGSKLRNREKVTDDHEKLESSQMSINAVERIVQLYCFFCFLSLFTLLTLIKTAFPILPNVCRNGLVHYGGFVIGSSL